jgi:pimeloyl-ACP methyl ester carboxylesterase
MLTTRAFKTGELTLSYAKGPVNGPPLVMMHGVLGRWQDFAGMIPHLTDSWHVYAIDLRGHGESERAPDGSGYLLRDLVGDISHFLSNVIPEEEEIVLIGFSAGGLAAIPLAAAFPQRIRGVVALEPAFMMRNSSITSFAVSQEIAWAHHAAQAAGSFEELVGMCRDILPEANDATITSFAERLYKADPRLSDLQQIDQGLDGMDLDSLIRQVRCPVLMVRGEQEMGSVVRDEDIAWATAANPRVRAVDVPGGGHGIFLEQPEAVLAHVLALLETVHPA